MENNYTPKRGDIFKTKNSVGVVMDTYISPDTGEMIVKVNYPMNIISLRQPEFVTLASLGEAKIKQATQGDLEIELCVMFGAQMRQYQTRINDVLALAGLPPVEVNPILGGSNG